MKKALTVFLIYAALMLADGGLTLYNTPDLSMEGNPLVAKLGLGWGALITVNLVFFVIIFLCCRYTFCRYKTILADVPNTRSYISQIFYNRPDKFSWFFYKLPKNWKPFIAYTCYILPYAMIIGAVIRVAEWLAITFRVNADAYFQFRNAYAFGRLDIILGIISIIPLSVIWFRKEFKEAQIKSRAQSGVIDSVIP